MVTTRSKLRDTLQQGASDPAAVLERDAMLVTFGNLSAPDLCAAARVSKLWKELVDEENLWQALCEALWRGKVYCPAAGRGPLGWKQKYQESLLDADRTELNAEELCSFRWTFRFKRTAGIYWTSIDPYWTGEGPQMRRFFHLGGSITAPANDPLWGEHEIRWRFTKSKEGRKGHFVKINHWPSLSISRTPNWGWRMENQWVVYEADLQEGGPHCQGVIVPASSSSSGGGDDGTING